ncbi:MAG: type II toxin-antitoxin system VapC family toxin [Terracidiphilus sp.]|jgi:predicted nucleic acid-binding protein
MIVLDTNVISELMLPRPEAQMVRWMDSQPGPSLWTTSINIYEIRYGLQSMPAGKKRSTLILLFERWLAEVIQQRILSFDAAAAQCAADLATERKVKGRPGDARDTMIAGIVLASHATLATRNVKHFEDIASSVVNPWDRG